MLFILLFSRVTCEYYQIDYTDCQKVVGYWSAWGEWGECHCKVSLQKIFFFLLKSEILRSDPLRRAFRQGTSTNLLLWQRWSRTGMWFLVRSTTQLYRRRKMHGELWRKVGQYGTMWRIWLQKCKFDLFSEKKNKFRISKSDYRANGQDAKIRVRNILIKKCTRIHVTRVMRILGSETLVMNRYAYGYSRGWPNIRHM